jgi:hypothetical protein
MTLLSLVAGVRRPVRSRQECRAASQVGSLGLLPSLIDDQAEAAAEARARAAHEELAKAVRVERELRAEAEQRAAAAAELSARVHAAAATQAPAPRPERCQLGGTQGCDAPAEIKVADAWGDAAWGGPAHVEEALLNVRTVFIASEDLGGLAAYRNR